MVWHALNLDTGLPLGATMTDPALRRLRQAFGHRLDPAGLDGMERFDTVTHVVGEDLPVDEQIHKVYTCVAAPPAGPRRAWRVWKIAVTYYNGDYRVQFTHHQWSTEGYCWVPTLAGFRATDGRRPLAVADYGVPAFRPRR